MSEVDTTLIQALQNAALYPHPVERFEVIETHISWVLLTGPHAYKIKKPVNLGFLDFSTLSKRRFFCQEEIRLNRRLAPQLYIGVVSINGQPEQPTLNAGSPTIEYAVKMVQFPQPAQMDRMLARGALDPTHIDRIAQHVAAFHACNAVAGAQTPYGSPERIQEPVRENFAHIREQLRSSADMEILTDIEAWTEAAFGKHREDFRRRKRGGFVRECHGDMHLRNMALIDDDIVIFDCIEFNDNLHWIDVMSEIAFIEMDLEDRHQPGFARRFLNAYLETTGDYEGLEVLRYYQVYRAMVRAKVAAIRLGQHGLKPGEGEAAYAELLDYLQLANHYVHRAEPALLINHGLSGSGKTTVSQGLLEALGAIRIRSDVERKRLFGLPPQGRTGSGLDQGIYGEAAGTRTYDHLDRVARIALAAGYPVIVDAACLKRHQRQRFVQLAHELRVPCTILDYRASTEALRERVALRAQHGGDASDATLAVLEHQLAEQDPLTGAEGERVLTIDTQQPVDVSTLAAALRGRWRTP